MNPAKWAFVAVLVIGLSACTNPGPIKPSVDCQLHVSPGDPLQCDAAVDAGLKALPAGHEPPTRVVVRYYGCPPGGRCVPDVRPQADAFVTLEFADSSSSSIAVAADRAGTVVRLWDLHPDSEPFHDEVPVAAASTLFPRLDIRCAGRSLSAADCVSFVESTLPAALPQAVASDAPRPAELDVTLGATVCALRPALLPSSFGVALRGRGRLPSELISILATWHAPS